jgi:prepilin peptidase CpaA
MLANPFVNQVVLLILAGLLIAAAIEDVRRLIIPNRYCLAIVLLYPLHVLASTTPVDWTGGLIVGGILFAVGYALFALGILGGGDAKLLAAVAPWAGPALLAQFIFVTALAGGAVAFAMIIRRWRAAPAKPRPTSSIVARVVASMTVFLSNLVMARGRIATSAAQAALGGVGSAAVPASARPVGILPYGVAISVGGLMVAVLLMMRG